MTWADRYREQAEGARASAQHYARIGDESTAKHWQNVAKTYDDLAEKEEARLESYGVRSVQC